MCVNLIKKSWYRKVIERRKIFVHCSHLESKFVAFFHSEKIKSFEIFSIAFFRFFSVRISLFYVQQYGHNTRSNVRLKKCVKKCIRRLGWPSLYTRLSLRLIFSSVNSQCHDVRSIVMITESATWCGPLCSCQIRPAQPMHCWHFASIVSHSPAKYSDISKTEEAKKKTRKTLELMKMAHNWTLTRPDRNYDLLETTISCGVTFP